MDFFDLFTETKGVPKPERRMETPCPDMGEDACGKVLAMAYIPVQKWGRTYEPQTGLEQGTIFPDLNFPFLGKEGVKKYD